MWNLVHIVMLAHALWEPNSATLGEKPRLMYVVGSAFSVCGWGPSKVVTIQMKVAEQIFLVLLYVWVVKGCLDILSLAAFLLVLFLFCQYHYYFFLLLFNINAICFKLLCSICYPDWA